MNSMLNVLESLLEGSQVSIDWDGNLLKASGPSAIKNYRPVPKTDEKNNSLGADEFYVSEWSPEYDLYLLRDRILGDVVQASPEFIAGGHAVMLSEGHTWADFNLAGQIATVDGLVSSPKQSICMVFRAGCHRGYGVRHTPYSEASALSSGGPCPRFVSPTEFVYSGQYVESHFWRWRERAVAHGGEYYWLKVPLWYWTPGCQGATN